MGITVTGGITFSGGMVLRSPVPPSYYVVVSHNDVPLMSAYPWSGSTGFGTKFANPVSLPAGAGRGDAVAFSPQGNAISLTYDASPRWSAWQWSTSGFGTKYTDPAGFDGVDCRSTAFSPAGDAVACVSANVGTVIFVYTWSSSTGFGTKFTQPSFLGQIYGVSWSPSGNAIALAARDSPYVRVYAWSGSGFGTQFSNPATVPPNESYTVSWAPAGDAISVGGSPSGGVAGLFVYPWSGSGFGTKFTNPGTISTTETYNGTAFSPSGSALAVTSSPSAPGLTAYQWSGSGFGTKFTDPSPALNGQTDVAFSPLGDSIAVTGGASPTMNAYPWSGSGFGTRFANPATMPPSQGYGIAFGTIQE
jgi:hypothetical protein